VAYLGVLPVWDRVTVMAAAPECKARVQACQWLRKRSQWSREAVYNTLHPAKECVRMA